MICYVVTLDFAKILKTYEYYILSYRFFIQTLIIEVHGMLYVGHISVGDCDSFNEFFKKLTDLFCVMKQITYFCTEIFEKIRCE